MNKTKDWPERLLLSLLIAGAVILLIGLYYAVIKAGIPYQDPPLELQIRYTVNEEIGKVLTRTGLVTLLLGLVGRLVLRAVRKKQEGRQSA